MLFPLAVHELCRQTEVWTRGSCASGLIAHSPFPPRLCCLHSSVTSYRFLHHSGFEHSAYAFGHESFIYKSSLESSTVAPGALISFVQKGLQYAEIEQHINDDGTESVCDETFSLTKKHVCKPKHAKRKIFNAFDSLDADYGALEIDTALMLRQPMDAARGDTVGSSGLRNMSVCIMWHPLVPLERNNKRGAAANAAADAAAQNTLVTANADGSVRIWEWRDEEEEEDEKKEGDAEAAAAAASTPKVPFQKGYFCTRTLDQPLPTPAPAVAADADADTPLSTAPVSALAAAADASVPMQDTPAATSASSSADQPAADAAAAASSSSSSAAAAAAAAPAAAAAASSSSAAAAASSSEGGSNKRQKLNDSTAVSSCGHDHSSPSSAAAAASCHINSNRSVVAVDWHPKGHTIACGSYTGTAYLWSLKGALLHTLVGHSAPITCLSFNKTGTLLLTGSVDHTLIVWDVETGALKQRWHLHTGPVLDIEWCPVFVSSSTTKNKESVALQSTHPDNQFMFASCSTDGNIWVVDVRSEPQQQTDAHAATAAASASAAAASSSSAAALAAGSGHAPRCLTGHEGEVNCVSWDPTGTLLLSGSDDGTAKIWSAATGDIVHDLVDHAREVLVARWSGTGACTDYHKYPLFVATGSVDTTVKLWDPTSGACLHTLSQHTHPVSQVAFAPRQQLLATASHERIFLWSLTTGTLLRTFKNLGDPELQVSERSRGCSNSSAPPHSHALLLPPVLALLSVFPSLAHRRRCCSLHVCCCVVCQTPNHVPLGMLGGLNALAFDNKGEQIAVSYADGMTYVIDLTNKQAWEEHARNAH